MLRHYSSSDYLAERVAAARAAIAADVSTNPERTGMGSTVVAALVEGDAVWLAHVGDSRAYLWDDDRPVHARLRPLTIDHSVAQLAVDAGTLTPLQALTDWRRHQLTRAIGDDYPGCELAEPLALPQHSCLLLVSDGVYGVLPDEAIAYLLERYRGPALVRALRDAVYAAGAPDNLAIALLDQREG